MKKIFSLLFFNLILKKLPNLLKKFILNHLRTYKIWIPISYAYNLLHKFIFFNFLNSSYCSKIRKDSKIKPYKIEKANKKFKDLSNEIYSFLLKDNLLNDIKKNMLRSKSRTSYKMDIYPYLSKKLRSKLFKYAISDKEINQYLESYFGFKPRLNDIYILFNIFKKDLAEEGSKLWHRDNNDTDLMQMKIFIPITKITSKNGPFFFLKNEQLMNGNMAIKEMSGLTWVRGRVPNETVKKLKGDIQSTEGMESGSKIYFDSRKIYHKGGYSIADDRLMIQFRYNANSYVDTKPQDFSEEIFYLRKTKDKNLINFIKEYNYQKDYYLGMNRFDRFIRLIIFKLTPIFTYYSKV